MAEFDISVVSTFGTALCAAYFDIEGDSPFIVSAYINVFKRLERQMEILNNTQEVDVFEI